MKRDIPSDACPLNGFQPCRERGCAWYIQVRGHNPNTGEAMDHWGCAVVWLPILTIENSQQQRQTGAAVESFRNEMVKANDFGQKLILTSMQAIKPEGTPHALLNYPE